MLKNKAKLLCLGLIGSINSLCDLQEKITSCLSGQASQDPSLVSKLEAGNKPKEKIYLFDVEIKNVKMSADKIEFDIASSGLKFEIYTGDILKSKADAIVNPANSYLTNAGGLALAIANAAGEKYTAYIDSQRETNSAFVDHIIPPGSGFITPSFNLEKDGIKAIVNVVGPDCRDIQQKKSQGVLLYNTYINALKTTTDPKYKIKSIAFPSVSTGIFMCEANNAANIALKTLVQNGNKENPNIKVIKIVLYDINSFMPYAQVMLRNLPKN